METYTRSLRRNRFYIVTSLRVDSLFLAHLISTETLDDQDCEIIEAENSATDKAYRLCSLLHKKGAGAYKGFLEALEATGQHDIVAKLKGDDKNDNRGQEASGSTKEKSTEHTLMDARYRNLLVREQAYLQAHLEVSRDLLGPFVDGRLISERQRDCIMQAGLTNQERVFSLCGLLITRGTGAFTELFKALSDSRQELIQLYIENHLQSAASEMAMSSADTQSVSTDSKDAPRDKDTSGGEKLTEQEPSAAEPRETADGAELSDSEESSDEEQSALQHKAVLDRVKPFLVEHLSFTMSFFAHLAKRCSISSDEKDTLMQADLTDEGRLLALLDLIRDKGADGFNAFLGALAASGQNNIKSHVEKSLTEVASDEQSPGGAPAAISEAVGMGEAAGGEVSGSVEEAADDLAAVLARLCVDGSDVNSADEYGRTGLHLAAWDGRTDDARTLIRAGANLDARNVGGRTPLHYACFNYTPLHYACINGHTSIVHALVAGGADTQIRSRGGFTPRDYARRNGHAAILELLPP